MKDVLLSLNFLIFLVCYKERFLFSPSLQVFWDILIQRHSTSLPYFKCAPICLISLRWFCYADRLTLLLLLYEDSSLFYMQGSVSQNILLSSGRLYYSSICLFSFFISYSKKNHSQTVYKNTVHLVKPCLFKGVVIARTTPDQCSNACQI